jgi:hypothetical protein
MTDGQDKLAASHRKEKNWDLSAIPAGLSEIEESITWHTRNSAEGLHDSSSAAGS